MRWAAGVPPGGRTAAAPGSRSLVMLPVYVRFRLLAKCSQRRRASLRRKRIHTVKSGVRRVLARQSSHRLHGRDHASDPDGGASSPFPRSGKIVSPPQGDGSRLGALTALGGAFQRVGGCRAPSPRTGCVRQTRLRPPPRTPRGPSTGRTDAGASRWPGRAGHQGTGLVPHDTARRMSGEPRQPCLGTCYVSTVACVGLVNSTRPHGGT